MKKKETISLIRNSISQGLSHYPLNLLSKNFLPSAIIGFIYMTMCLSALRGQGRGQVLSLLYPLCLAQRQEACEQ